VRLTGTLHVSLPTDIIQLFGTGSVPVLVAGSVLGVFELGEKFASQRAKDALSKWLLTFDVQKAKALPDGTQELFERIFGERHFSLKCFVRSAAFSLGAIAFIGILALMINPHLIKAAIVMGWISLAQWLPWSIIIDYISLLKTRVVLRSVARLQLRNMFVAIVVLVLDFGLYIVIFNLSLAILVLLPVIFAGTLDDVKGFISNYWMVIPTISHCNIDLRFPERLPASESELFFIIFWSGFVPSIWMWLYVLALFVTRGLLRSEKVVNWLRWALDVERSPFRSIGAVAATLAFIASVAIILVSAEVSRMSAA
jgi:hypothetical protein